MNVTYMTNTQEMAFKSDGTATSSHTTSSMVEKKTDSITYNNHLLAMPRMMITHVTIGAVNAPW